MLVLMRVIGLLPSSLQNKTRKQKTVGINGKFRLATPYRIKEKSFDFSDPMLRLELMLDGYSPDFRIEKIFQETSRLEVF